MNINDLLTTTEAPRVTTERPLSTADPFKILQRPVVLNSQKPTSPSPTSSNSSLSAALSPQSAALPFYLQESEARKFRCTWPNCPKAYKRREALMKHLPVHTGEKKWACDQCPRKFIRVCRVPLKFLSSSSLACLASFHSSRLISPISY